MRWPRENWAERLADAPHPTPARAAIAFAVWAIARDGVDVIRLSVPDVQRRTGLGRTAAAAALREVVADGWLTVVGDRQKGRTPTFRLTAPGAEKVATRPSALDAAPVDTGREGRHTTFSAQDGRSPSDLLDSEEGRHTTFEGRYTAFSRIAPSSPTETPPPDTRTAAIDALWMVVVESLPGPLALSLTRLPRIDDALGRHADEGWTVDQLGAAVRGRSWAGAQGGAVVTWLSNLTAPPAPAVPERLRPRCTAHYQPQPCSGCAADMKAAS